MSDDSKFPSYPGILGSLACRQTAPKDTASNGSVQIPPEIVNKDAVGYPLISSHFPSTEIPTARSDLRRRPTVKPNSPSRYKSPPKFDACIKKACPRTLPIPTAASRDSSGNPNSWDQKKPAPHRDIAQSAGFRRLPQLSPVRATPAPPSPADRGPVGISSKAASAG